MDDNYNILCETRHCQNIAEYEINGEHICIECAIQTDHWKNKQLKIKDNIKSLKANIRRYEK